MYRRLIAYCCLVLAGCTGAEPESLVLYSGRSKALVEPLVLKYQEATGTAIDVRYGDTAQLAVALIEEGDQTAADLFWAQDAGALGAVSAAGLLSSLPDSLLQRVESSNRGSGGAWVATSGRARTLAYSSLRASADELPASVFDLTKPIFRGRVGWAPANGSFQSFVTAMILTAGDERTREWLDAMKANGAKTYSNNTSILQAIANGEIDFGLPNHYYLFRFKSEDPAFPVDQTTFESGDVGNLLNVAGIGRLAPSREATAAMEFISYVLGPESQTYFATETNEYPVSLTADSSAHADRAGRPAVSLDELRDLERTLEMLREAGLL
jgi:iron(III) transport system substrate-binding protein